MSTPPSNKNQNDSSENEPKKRTSRRLNKDPSLRLSPETPPPLPEYNKRNVNKPDDKRLKDFRSEKFNKPKPPPKPTVYKDVEKIPKSKGRPSRKHAPRVIQGEDGPNYPAGNFGKPSLYTREERNQRDEDIKRFRATEDKSTFVPIWKLRRSLEKSSAKNPPPAHMSFREGDFERAVQRDAEKKRHSTGSSETSSSSPQQSPAQGTKRKTRNSTGSGSSLENAKSKKNKGSSNTPSPQSQVPVATPPPQATTSPMEIDSPHSLDNVQTTTPQNEKTIPPLRLSLAFQDTDISSTTPWIDAQRRKSGQKRTVKSKVSFPNLPSIDKLYDSAQDFKLEKTLEQMQQEFLEWSHDRHLQEGLNNTSPTHISWDMEFERVDGPLSLIIPPDIKEEMENLEKLENEDNNLLARENAEFLRSFLILFEVVSDRCISNIVLRECFEPGSEILDLFNISIDALLQMFQTGRFGKMKFPEMNDIVSNLCPAIERFFKDGDRVPAPSFPTSSGDAAPDISKDPLIITAKDLKTKLPKNNGFHCAYWDEHTWKDKRLTDLYGVVLGCQVDNVDMLSLRPGGYLTNVVMDALIRLMMLKYPSNRCFVMSPTASQPLFQDGTSFALEVIGNVANINAEYPNLEYLFIPLHVGTIGDQDNSKPGHFFVARLQLSTKKIFICNPIYPQGHQLCYPDTEDAFHDQVVKKLKLVKQFAEALTKTSWDTSLGGNWPESAEYSMPALLCPQINGYDCGVLSLLYIEIHLQSVQTFNDEHTAEEKALLLKGRVYEERARYFAWIRRHLLPTRGAPDPDEVF